MQKAHQVKVKLRVPKCVSKNFDIVLTIYQSSELTNLNIMG